MEFEKPNKGEGVVKVLYFGVLFLLCAIFIGYSLPSEGHNANTIIINKTTSAEAVYMSGDFIILNANRITAEAYEHEVCHHLVQYNYSHFCGED